MSILERTFDWENIFVNALQFEWNELTAQGLRLSSILLTKRWMETGESRLWGGKKPPFFWWEALHWARPLFTCVLTLLLTGCQTTQPIQFGIYGVPAKELAAAKALGMNFVVGPGSINYLDSALASGLGVIGTGLKTRQAENHPSVVGSYLADEPDLHDIAPEIVSTQYQQAKRLFKKPIYLNLSAGASAELYGRHCDVLMFDWYPVGWQPVATFNSQLRLARLAVQSKPFYAVAQAFDWSNYPKVMPPSTSYRKPTVAEIRAMTIWAAMSGASGIAFYPFDDGQSRLTDSPELVAAIKESIAIVREHEANLRQPRIWAPYPFDYLKRESEYNEVIEPSVAVKYSRLTDNSGNLFLAAANTTPNTIQVTARSGIELIDADPVLTFAPFEVKFLFVGIQKK